MVTKERFFEVYNGHPDVHHLGDETHAGVERMWDIINTLRIGEMKAAPVSGLATDDSHNYFGHGRLVARPGLGHGAVPVPDPGVGHRGDRGGGLLRLQRRDAAGGPLLARVEGAGTGDRARRGRPGTRPGSSGRSRATKTAAWATIPFKAEGGRLQCSPLRSRWIWPTNDPDDFTSSKSA